MKREIKFRGIYKNTFVYGNYIKANIDGRTFYQIENSDSNDFAKWEVDGNTIGQFTGFVLKDGSELYVGDKVSVKGRRKMGVYETEVIESPQGFTLKENKTYINNDRCFIAIDSIIGNIYEDALPK